MIKHLKEALIAMLAEETWMDDSTRNLAIAKVWRNKKTRLVVA